MMQLSQISRIAVLKWGGVIFFLAGSNGNYAPIHWQSKKIKRVVKSTIAAETLELLEAAEHCFFIRTVLCEIYKLNAKEDVLPAHLLTDNNSLYEAAYSTKTLSDKRLKIDICIIRECCQQVILRKLNGFQKNSS